MPARILHILSQRPSLTGSGVTLEAIVRHAGEAGWDQRVICGVAADDPRPSVADLDPARLHPLVFGGGLLGFAVPGMSDVMPYPSTVFSKMTPRQLAAYRQAWKAHISQVLSGFEPDIIHSHHVWIVSSLLKDIAPRVPVVTQCHATGLRQLRLCPHLADDVAGGCTRNDRFLVQNPERGDEIARTLSVPQSRIHVVGAGFREDLFHARGRDPGSSARLLYCGKYSNSKGLPWLLDAFEILRARRSDLELHVAGSGSGAEAQSIAYRMHSIQDVVLHGQLSQPRLADLMRTSGVMVMPSFFEGVPLVLVEAAACGCRLVATRLPGVEEKLVPLLGDALDLVPLPRLAGIDVPDPTDLPTFVENLSGCIEAALEKPPLPDLRETLAPFTWQAVFRRIERVWNQILDP